MQGVGSFDFSSILSQLGRLEVITGGGGGSGDGGYDCEEEDGSKELHR